IGSKFLHAGPGYGGSCFPKDTLALVRTAQQFQTPTRIIEAVVEVNATRKRRMVDKIEGACGGSVKGKTIAILGLTFKPETDDMRDAPSLDIVPGLIERGARVQAHDPQGMKEAKHMLPEEVIYCSTPYEAAKQADAIVIITEWNEYRALDIEELSST